MKKEELNPRGYFVAGDNKIYKCLFYDTRGCPVRKQMNILDEDLVKEKIVAKQEIIRVKRTLQGQDTDYEYPERKDVRNTADWLVSNFCRICPHREA